MKSTSVPVAFYKLTNISLNIINIDFNAFINVPFNALPNPSYQGNCYYVRIHYI